MRRSAAQLLDERLLASILPAYEVMNFVTFPGAEARPCVVIPIDELPLQINKLDQVQAHGYEGNIVCVPPKTGKVVTRTFARRKKGEDHRVCEDPIMLTMQDVTGAFHLPLKDAAASFGMCPTSLKQACRKLGVRRWPYRPSTRAPRQCDSESPRSVDTAPCDKSTSSFSGKDDKDSRSDCDGPCLQHLADAVGFTISGELTPASARGEYGEHDLFKELCAMEASHDERQLSQDDLAFLGDGWAHWKAPNL
jgi:hypothetical protein